MSSAEALGAVSYAVGIPMGSALAASMSRAVMRAFCSSVKESWSRSDR